MHAGRSVRSVPGEAAPSLGLTIVVVHVTLVACFGQAYAKLQLPIAELPIYPTEVVVVLSVLLGGRAIRRVPFDAITKLVLAFLALGIAWVVIAGVGDPAGAGAKALSFFVYAVFYFVVRGGAVTEEQRWRFLRALMGAAVFASLVALWQMQAGTPVEETTTGSSRWLGGEFALYAVLAAMAAAIAAIAQRRLSAGAAVVLLAAAAELVFVQHRSGFVAFGVALVATALFLVGSAQALRGLLKLGILVIVGAVLATVVFGVRLDETIARVASIGDTADANIDWRLLAWYEVLDGIAARPLGHGFATWDFLFTSSDPLTGSHNAFLDLAYRVGVPGLALLVAPVVVLVVRTRELVQRAGPRAHLVAVAACGALLAFMLFASFNVVLASPHMSVLFWVLLGLGAAALPSRDPRA